MVIAAWTALALLAGAAPVQAAPKTASPPAKDRAHYRGGGFHLGVSGGPALLIGPRDAYQRFDARGFFGVDMAYHVGPVFSVRFDMQLVMTGFDPAPAAAPRTALLQTFALGVGWQLWKTSAQRRAVPFVSVGLAVIQALPDCVPGPEQPAVCSTRALGGGGLLNLGLNIALTRWLDLNLRVSYHLTAITAFPDPAGLLAGTSAPGRVVRLQVVTFGLGLSFAAR